MRIPPLLIGLLMAAAGTAAAAALIGTGQLALLGGLFAAVGVGTALLTGAGGQAQTQAGEPTALDASGEREEGAVKWFNGKKGFGFIIRDNGEEIFVHFRSIRGDEGRRGLRDGQRVGFRVAQTDKGPQAEDVEAL